MLSFVPVGYRHAHHDWVLCVPLRSEVRETRFETIEMGKRCFAYEMLSHSIDHLIKNRFVGNERSIGHCHQRRRR